MIPLKPLPDPQQPIVGSSVLTLAYAQYLKSLDAVLRAVLASPPNVQTANYTLQLSDMAGIVELNSAGAITLTVPPDNSVPFQIGSWFRVTQAGAGQASVSGGVGVTVRFIPGFSTTLTAQWGVALLYKRAANDWVMSGDLLAPP